MRGIIITIVLVIVGSAVLIAGRWYLGSQEGQTARDIERIADIGRIQYGFERLFLAEAGYISATNGKTCVRGTDVRACGIERYVHELASLIDPRGTAYVVTVTPTKDAYGIQFVLEGSYGNLKEGIHELTQDGIR